MNIDFEASCYKSLFLFSPPDSYQKMRVALSRSRKLIGENKPDTSLMNFEAAFASMIINGIEDLEKKMNFELAERMYRSVIWLDPSPEYFCKLGHVLLKQYKYEAAISLFKREILKRQDAKAYIHLGYCLCFIERYEEAIEKFDRAIEISSRSWLAYWNKSMALFHLKRYPEAEEAFIEGRYTSQRFARRFELDGGIDHFTEKAEVYEKLLESEVDQEKRVRLEKAIEGAKYIVKLYQDVDIKPKEDLDSLLGYL